MPARALGYPAWHLGTVVWFRSLGLIVLGMLASLWALLHTHSLFLAAWVFFLMQALFSVLPLQISSAKTRSAQKPDDDFERAYCAAEAAVRQLSSQP